MPVVKCRSKSDNIYYRCSKRCGNWWFEDAYELYLRNNHADLLERTVGSGFIQPVEVVQQSPGTVVQGMHLVTGEVKMLALDMKMQLGDIKLEIGNLRNEVIALKEEVRKGKNPIVVDATAVGVVLAVFVAILVATVWKK